MPDATDLVGRQESHATLVRFGDATDGNTPRLNYAVPLPGALEGRFYLETDLGPLGWRPAASVDRRVTPAVLAFLNQTLAGAAADPPPLDRIAYLPRAAPARALPAAPAVSTPTTNAIATRRPLAGPGLVRSGNDWRIEVSDLSIPFAQVAAEARRNRALVVSRSLGGAARFGFVAESQEPRNANPRFVIVEHYRLSSFFGDYGAGRTLSVFSLMPGEETRLYVRSWRRSEQKMKEASSVFDSYTQEAADDFEETLESEVTDRENYEKSKAWDVKFSHAANFGWKKLFSASHQIDVSSEGSTKQAREQMSKSVDKTTRHHATKSSAKRETTVSTEIEASEAQEFETITERTIKNTNLSRTLNIVARELNQEFTTYLALIDVTIAFVNDLGVFDEFAIHELDDMLLKYLPAPPPSGGIVTETPEYWRVRAHLLEQIRTVFDFRGTQHDFLEQVRGLDDRFYLRVRRSRQPSEPNPFYPDGGVPVEGIVLSVTRNTVRTDAVIIDSLLGHGVALDNYALGMQQETLRKAQLDNHKVELALALIDGNDAVRLEAYRSIFGSVDDALLRQVAVGAE